MSRCSLRAAATALQGRGGGKDDVAQGGGTEVTGIDQALTDIRVAIQRTLQG